jgi:hypothetical protein
MSQGKYGPIAKYAADGGIIQGYARGDSVRSSFGQLDQAPNPGALAREIQYDPIRNAKAVEAFARFLNPLGMSINDVAQQIKAGNTEGIFKDIAKSMIPFYKTGEKLSEGDMSGAAASLVPSGIKAIYNLITSPEAGRNVTSQVPNEITSTLADYNPEDLRTAVMATIPEFDTAQANTSLSRGFTPSVAQPSGMQDFGTFEDMARGAQAQKEQQANNGEVVSFGVPDQNTEQFVDQYSLAQPEAQALARRKYRCSRATYVGSNTQTLLSHACTYGNLSPSLATRSNCKGREHVQHGTCMREDSAHRSWPSDTLLLQWGAWKSGVFCCLLFFLV